MRQERDLTKGAIVKSLWLFALPLMLGNVLQQLYNLVDTWVVGRYLGKRALAAVGASYTLMTFLTSVVIGLCLGAGAFFAMAYGRREKETFRNGIFMSFTAIGGLSIVLTILLYGFVRPLTYLLQVPAETVEDMVTYLIYVFAGFFATFLYNYFASVLRSIGNSVLPLVFLGISVALNIGLDLLFVVTFSFGIAGAAVATVISQYIAGIGLMLYFLFRYSDLCPAKKDFIWEKKNFRQILSLSGFTCLQQSVMKRAMPAPGKGFFMALFQAFEEWCGLRDLSSTPAASLPCVNEQKRTQMKPRDVPLSKRATPLKNGDA